MGKFAVIGAGPMGLATARQLKKHGMEFVGFDGADDVGGLWNIDGPRSTMYESAHLISSKRMTEFTEFPMADEVAEFPSHRDLKKYFGDYADHFGLREHYRLGAWVEKVERLDDGRWQVTDSTGFSETFDGVMIANGTLSEPNMPELPGEFSGEFIHSAEYKSADVFAGKRVLLIGAGNSACDIAIDAVHRAKSVDMSVRRGYHFVPKYIFGKPADTVGGAIQLPRRLKQWVDSRILKWFTGDAMRYGFPKPDHKLYEAHPIVNSMVIYHMGHGDITVQQAITKVDGNTVTFNDGQTGEYDMILACTGYLLHYPFIDKAELNWTGPRPDLYMNCMHPSYDNLFVLGMLEAAGIGWQGRADQAEMVVRFLKAVETGHPGADKVRAAKAGGATDLSGGFSYLKLDRMSFYVHKDTFLKTLRKHLKQLPE